MTTDEIEAELGRAWTLEMLEVYGDHLISLGDPRGELISIDVHIARHGDGPELQHRRRRALRAWLQLPAEVDPTRGAWRGVKFAFGFIDDLRVELAPDILRGPAGPYIRGLTLSQRPHTVAWLLAELAARPRPWLERLTLLPRFKGQPPLAVWSADPGGLALPDDLISMTPRLARLELAGHRMLRSFPHPAVTSLRIDGVDAFLPVLEPAAPMPAVTELELRFARGAGEPVTMQLPWPSLLPAASFPQLGRLDLSANDQRATTDTQVGVLEVLRTLGVRDQLVELRLPALLVPHEARTLEPILRRMSSLRRVEIEHGPRFSLAVEGVELVEVRPPWPREPGAITTATFRIERDRSVEVQLHGILRHCSHAASWLAAGALAAWEEIWQHLEALPYSSDGYRLPSTLLRTALDALGMLDPSYPELRGWVTLRERLRDLDGERDVQVTMGELA